MVKSQVNGQRNILTMKTELEVWEAIEYPQLIIYIDGLNPSYAIIIFASIFSEY